MTDTMLEKLIEEGIKENVPNEVIVEIVKQYAIQQPLDFGKVSEFDSDVLSNFLKDGDTFTEDAHFKIRLTGFAIYDSDGNKLVQINADGSVVGHLPYSFRMPSNDPEDEKQFRDFCKFLNIKFDSINYPIKAE